METFVAKVRSLLENGTVRKLAVIVLVLLAVVLVYGMGKRIGEFVYYTGN